MDAVSSEAKRSKQLLDLDSLDVDSLKGVSYESRKNTVQLLSADMLAWVTAKIRAAQLFGRGWSKEAKMVAFRFVDSGNLNIGFNATEQIQEWVEDEIAFLTAQNVEEASGEGEDGDPPDVRGL